MKSPELIFWIAFAIIFYSFIGYPILMWVLVKLKTKFSKPPGYDPAFEPEVTLLVPCYNEADIIEDKIKNLMLLDYPSHKLKIIFITDGSTDDSRRVLARFKNVSVMHINRRGGKTAAENRAMQFVDTPVVIFSDANTLLNTMAIKNIVRHFNNDKVGCVAGEKRILTSGSDVASAFGDGLFWRYVSFLKKLNSQLYSAVGAEGELVAFRTSLYESIPEDTILNHFIQSMYMACNGYVTVYEPEAFTVETASASVQQELKRKIRICAGGCQAIKRISSRLNIRKYPVLSFQYFSHRVLRWTVNPFLLLVMLVVSLSLSFSSAFYLQLFSLQCLFYAGALTGFVLQNRSIKIKALVIPYYFCVMNYAVIAGLWRFLNGNQIVLCEKNKRLSAT